MQRLSPARWTVRDAIDFEQWLASVDDGAIDEHTAAFASARASVHATPASGPGGTPADRGALFLDWTRFVRERTPDASVGDRYRRARQVAAALLGTAGFVVGAGLAGSLLARRDAEPVNALLFLGATVGLQVAFLAAVALAAALRAAKVRLGPPRATVMALVRLLGRAVDRLDGARRDALRARWAALDLRAERLGPLIGCELLVVTQWFAIAFNAGLLAAMLLVYLPFEELRFGWQSTYSFTTGGVEAAVQAIAAPWSWLPTLVPDAADIAATRYARGQRAETLPADAAHAWWPFLIAAIVVYGLAVRLLLAAAGQSLLRHRLRRLTFTQPAANALWRRLAGPLLRPSGGVGRLPTGTAVTPAIVTGGVDLLIVDREWDMPLDLVRARVERLFDGPVARVAAASVDDDALPEEVVAAPPAASVVVAVAARRDPIVAVAGFLNALAARSRDAAITVVLIADDGADDGASDGADGGVPDERLAIWRRFAAIQRLRVGVERSR